MALICGYLGPEQVRLCLRQLLSNPNLLARRQSPSEGNTEESACEVEQVFDVSAGALAGDTEDGRWPEFEPFRGDCLPAIGADSVFPGIELGQRLVYPIESTE